MQPMGSRGILITFDELVDTEFDTTTNIYIITNNQNSIVIDTFLGPDLMADTFDLLKMKAEDVSYVINTHSDWDHIWGNPYFKEAKVITHKNFLERLEQSDEMERADLLLYAKGEIEKAAPDILFTDELYLPKEELKLFWTPGHTRDAISIYDERDRILIVGDNAEYPIPSYVDPRLLENHQKVLEEYLSYDFEFLIPGHGTVLSRENIEENLQYIKDLIEGDEEKLAAYEEQPYQLNHRINQIYMDEVDPFASLLDEEEDEDLEEELTEDLQALEDEGADFENEPISNQFAEKVEDFSKEPFQDGFALNSREFPEEPLSEELDEGRRRRDEEGSSNQSFDDSQVVLERVFEDDLGLENQSMDRSLDWQESR